MQELLLSVYLSNAEAPFRWVTDKLHKDADKTGLVHINYFMPESDEESTDNNEGKGKGKGAEETTNITTSSSSTVLT